MNEQTRKLVSQKWLERRCYNRLDGGNSSAFETNTMHGKRGGISTKKNGGERQKDYMWKNDLCITGWMHNFQARAFSLSHSLSLQLRSIFNGCSIKKYIITLVIRMQQHILRQNVHFQVHFIRKKKVPMREFLS